VGLSARVGLSGRYYRKVVPTCQRLFPRPPGRRAAGRHDFAKMVEIGRAPATRVHAIRFFSRTTSLFSLGIHGMEKSHVTRVVRIRSVHRPDLLVRRSPEVMHGGHLPVNFNNLLAQASGFGVGCNTESTQRTEFLDFVY
jgi:hypothetical protein